jgi:hypothetical protein
MPDVMPGVASSLLVQGSVVSHTNPGRLRSRLRVVVLAGLWVGGVVAAWCPSGFDLV